MCLTAEGMFWYYIYIFCQEQWKTSSHTPGKRKDRSKNEDEEGGSEKRRRKGSKRRKDQKTKTQYEEDEEDEYRDEPEAEDDYVNLARDNDADNSERAPDHLLAAAGLEDSDAEDDMVRVVFFLVNNLCSLLLCYLLFPLLMCFCRLIHLILISTPLENLNVHLSVRFMLLLFRFIISCQLPYTLFSAAGTSSICNRTEATSMVRIWRWRASPETSSTT